MGRTLLGALNLAFSVPWLTLLGACGAADSRFSAWGGAAVGGLLGLFFGLAFGGALPRSVADYCFGPEEKAAVKEEREP
jgi:hydrogenase/urease accessory protein HupE